MADKISVKLNLAAFKHTVQMMKGANGADIEVLVIPVNANHLFKGTKGMYADLSGFPLKEPKDNNTHLLKQSLPKEVYSKQTDEEKSNMPIFGNVQSWGEGGGSNEAAVQTSAAGSALPWN